MNKLLMALLIVLLALTAHAQSVTVGWLPSPSEGVVSYNVYVADTSGGYQFGADADASSAALEATVDVAAHVGKTIYVVVTAINDHQLESGPSNELVIDLATGEWLAPNPPEGVPFVISVDTGN